MVIGQRMFLQEALARQTLAEAVLVEGGGLIQERLGRGGGRGAWFSMLCTF